MVRKTSRDGGEGGKETKKRGGFQWVGWEFEFPRVLADAAQRPSDVTPKFHHLVIRELTE